MKFQTNGDYWRAVAVAQGVPLRTLDQVKADLARDFGREPEIAYAFARLMAKHGRLTNEARAYAAQYTGE